MGPFGQSLNALEQGWEFGAMAPKIAPDSFIERQVHKPSASKREFSFANSAVGRLRAKN